MSKASPAAAIGAAFGVAVVAALAQLGLASGLAIVIWREGSATEWATHLSWAAWLAAVSTVVGAFTAGRLSSEIGVRVTAVLAAGIGGFVVAPLIAVPAMRFTETGLSSAPFAAAGIGAVAGAIMAGIGLAWRPVSINVMASIALTWVLAGLAAFVPAGDDLGSLVRLGVWGSWADLVPEVAPPMLVGCILIGAVTAWLSDGKAAHRITAVSGAAGPLLVIAGYAASRQPGVQAATNWTGIWIGVYAALAGLLGSLLVTALRHVPAKPATAPVSPTTSTPTPEPQTTINEPAEQTYEMPAATAPAPTDPFGTSDYDRYDEAELGEFAETRPTEPVIPRQPEPDHQTDFTTPQPAREGEDPVAEISHDETESWVSDLKDDNAFAEQREASETEVVTVPESKKKRRWNRKKN